MTGCFDSQDLGSQPASGGGPGSGGTSGAGAGGSPSSGGGAGDKPECGNGTLEVGEQCDGKVPAEISCSSFGHKNGNVTCTSKCTLDTSACHTCGDGTVEGPEDCDGGLDGKRCDSIGKSGGKLTCKSDCKWESGACYSCGDGKCDGLLGENSDTCLADCPWKAPRVVAGGRSVCALKPDGTAKCWGSNAGGRLGTGTDTGPDVCAAPAGFGKHANCSLKPVDVTVVPNLVDLAMGAVACGVDPDGNLFCWGPGALPLLGNGTLGTDLAQPTVPSLTSTTTVSVGASSACAIGAGERVNCWGSNTEFQLGLGGITGPMVCSQDAKGISNWWCAAKPYPITLTAKARAVTTAPAHPAGGGNQHACAVMKDGNAYCWGQNKWGQLGDGTQNANAWPIKVQADTHFVTIAAATYHTCATDTAGAVWCWGKNSSGDLGLGHAKDDGNCFGNFQKCYTRPQRVPGIDDARIVRTGHNTTCVIRGGDGELWCWGHNGTGMLGLPTSGPENPASASGGVSTKPVHVANLKQVSSVALDTGGQICTAHENGKIQCWGMSQWGSMGTGKEYEQSLTPLQVLPAGW